MIVLFMFCNVSREHGNVALNNQYRRITFISLLLDMSRQFCTSPSTDTGAGCSSSPCFFFKLKSESEVSLSRQ